MVKMENVSRLVALCAVVVVAACQGGAEQSLEEIYSEMESRSHTQGFCEGLYRFDHLVTVGGGTQLRVTETFSTASALRIPRRAILMMPGTLVTGDQWAMEVDEGEEFDALARAARAGYFAYSVTYEGYPGSELPADGSTVTKERSLEQMGDVVEWIRANRYVSRVDLFGASFGSSMAVALGGTQSPIPRWHVGRLVLQAHVYKGVTPLFEEVFFSPEVQAALEGAPGGYIPTVAEMYGLILLGADPAAAAYGFEHYPDVYATGPTLSGFDLPLFEGDLGRAPVLQFWGDADPITPLADAQQFQAEYGGDATLVTLPGGGHAPYIGPLEVRESFWTQSLAFLDYGPFNFYLACEP